MVIYQGNIAVDARGKVSFVNDFDFKDVKRFYMVENFEARGARGWHGHKKEAKYVFVPQGAAQIIVISMKTEEIVAKEILSDSTPRVLYIPSGNYNGAWSLVPGTKVVYFSTATLEESKKDDYRQPLNKWNPWSVE